MNMFYIYLTDAIFTPKQTIENDREGQTNIRVYAYGIVQCGDDKTDMTEYSETWRGALENRGMRISRSNIQSIDFKVGQDNGREPVKILGDELHRVQHYMYLGSSAEETGGMTTKITQRVSAAWRN